MARPRIINKPVQFSLQMSAQLKDQLEQLRLDHGIGVSAALRLGAAWVLDYYSRQPKIVRPAQAPAPMVAPVSIPNSGHSAPVPPSQVHGPSLGVVRATSELSASLGAMPPPPSNLDEAIDHPTASPDGVPVVVRPTVVPRLGAALKTRVSLDGPTQAPVIHEDPVPLAMSPYTDRQGVHWFSLHGFFEVTQISVEDFQSVVDWSEVVDRDPMDREVILRGTAERVLATLPEYRMAPGAQQILINYFRSLP